MGSSTGYTRDEIQAFNINLLYINSMDSYVTSVSLLYCNNLHCSCGININMNSINFMLQTKLFN